MASHHVRSASLTSHHTRSASTSSEIHITETVSSLQRCVFGNVFRSQRQLTRFGICLCLCVLGVYMFGPFGRSSEKGLHDPKPKATVTVRSVQGETQPESEYRATYFEEMGKRFANKGWRVKADSFHDNNILDPEVKEEEGQGSEVKVELDVIAEKVKEAARTVSQCREIPGLSVVLVKGDRGVQIPMGLADVNAGRPVTVDTKFLLNSISKTFLGQLLGVLISESTKNLTWDTRVVDILGPEFQLATEELTREVTLRDLLSQRSGLSSGNLAVQATYPPGWTRRQLVRHLKHLPVSMAFRKSFLYSNMAALLASYVIEVLGGASWERLMIDKLLTPLGMLSSQPITSLEELGGDDLSRMYVPVDGTVTKADPRIFNQGPLAPVSLLSTTARDVTAWLRFNLRQGKLLDGRTLIRPEVWRDMWTKQTELSPMFLAAVDKSGDRWPVKDVSVGYGLFWFINKYRGLKNFWHGGGLYSHHTLAWHFPERDAALYAVINGYSGDSRPFSVVESLAYYAADLLLGYQPWLDSHTLCTFPSLSGSPSRSNATGENLSENRMQETVKEAQRGGTNEKVRDKNDQPSENVIDGKFRPNLLLVPQNQMENGVLENVALKSYVGSYHSPLFGNFSVLLDSKSGQLQCQMCLLTGNLHFTQGHSFDVELTNSLRFLSKPSKSAPARPAFRISFVESRPGEITGVDVHSKWKIEVPLRFEKMR
ncbi:hypothetical protein ACOMHN_053454 [Nucella lapillus]